MNKVNDDDSAFPHGGTLARHPNRGMTLRDYFAAKAMQGYLTKIGIVGGIAPTDDDMARYSYEMADAMLRVREIQS